jgi:hypothetical protein
MSSQDLPSSVERRELLVRWAAARTSAVDLLEDAGLPVTDEWPPVWHLPIARTPREHEALAHLALLVDDGLGDRRDSA